MTDEKTLIIKKPQPHVTALVINRAERSNAFDNQLLQALLNAFQKIADDPHCHVVVLQSAGAHFSSGADLAWMQRMIHYTMDENEADAKLLSETLHCLDTLPQVTLAKVQGAALGGALGLIACCDLCVASDRSFFAFPEVGIGLIPAVISPYIIRSIGPKTARRWMLTGERFEAKQALSMQLINAVVSLEALEQHCQDWVTTLLNNAPQAVRVTKQLIRDVSLAISDPIRQHTIQTIAQCRVSEEAQVGLKAFLSKQAPPWKKP